MSNATKRQSQLVAIEKIAAKLEDAGLVALYEFSEFLAQKYSTIDEPALELNSIPRPKEESVIAAIKRLSKTYPMLDKKILFEQTSAAMSEHVMQEVTAKESIDRLEKVFLKEYQTYIEA